MSKRAGASQARPSISDAAAPSGIPPLIPFVREHGYVADSYLATAPGRLSFWSADRSGLVSYARVGFYVLVSGGLIGPPESQPQLLREFLEFTTAHGWRAIFFCIPAKDEQLFRDVGYDINKIGEDAFIDLGNVTFSGKRFEWVRRQANYCQRHGVAVCEIHRENLTDVAWTTLLQELDDVCRSTMSEKPQTGEMTFFDGTLGDHDLGARRLFVAQTEQDGQRRIEGYVVCNPMHGGKAWSTEIYRHRSDAVRGTVPFLFHEVILQLQQEGAKYISLCIAPGRNCEESLPGEKPFIRKSLIAFRDRGSLLFDMRGIDHFKSRFRPRYENSLVCSPPPPRMFATLTALGAVLATMWVFGLLKIDPLKMLKLTWARLRKNRTHVVAGENAEPLLQAADNTSSTTLRQAS